MNKMRLTLTKLMQRTSAKIPIRVDYDSDLDDDPDSWDTGTSSEPARKLYMSLRWEHPIIELGASELAIRVGAETILRLMIAERDRASAYVSCGLMGWYSATECIFRHTTKGSFYL